MKKDTLKVGTDKGEFYVEVEVNMPETLVDCAILAKIPETSLSTVHWTALNADKSVGASYMVAKFMRGYRIDLQEGGARQVVVEMLAGRSSATMMKDGEFLASVKKAVESEIAGFDPAAPRARGGRKPAAPQVVKLQGKKSYTEAEVKAMLSQLKGITVAEA